MKTGKCKSKTETADTQNVVSKNKRLCFGVNALSVGVSVVQSTDLNTQVKYKYFTFLLK